MSDEPISANLFDKVLQRLVKILIYYCFYAGFEYFKRGNEQIKLKT